MGRRVWLLFIILVLCMTTGCDFNFSVNSQETPTGLSDAEIATLSAFTTQANSAPVGIAELPTFTSTPDLNAQGQVEAQPTKTLIPGSIRITGISQKSPGVAQINWEATGEFPSGFKVIFTEEQIRPTYPENSYASVGSSTARSAVINYIPNRIYYVRVCRFLFEACDVYSDLGIFAYAPPTPTPKPTRTPASQIINGTQVQYDTSLVISLITGGGNGKAYFTWKDKSTTAKEYKIVYSSSSQVPAFGVDSYFSVIDTKARSAFVDGNSATKYYYRICRYDGNACTSYSAVYTFTFPTYSLIDDSTITINSITNIGNGIALVYWTGAGTFENGFKILYSQTTDQPTMTDNSTLVSDGAARSGIIIGDATGLYHVRMCKYSGSDCTVYSPVTDFQFSADPAVMTIEGASDNDTHGYIDLKWSIAGGTASEGYKLLYSSNPVPDLGNSSAVAADSGATAGTIPGTAGTHYYLRMCKSIGSLCGNYSNIIDFTTAP